MSVMYLSTRNRFNWDEVNFSLFTTFVMISGFVGKSNHFFIIFNYDIILSILTDKIYFRNIVLFVVLQSQVKNRRQLNRYNRMF